MKYVLMHKEIPVAAIDLDEVLCGVRKIEEVYNEAHLPVGIHIRHGVVDRTELNEWWVDRSIPASRSGVRKALEVLNLSNTRMLLTKCFGLSLSDQYWIRPACREDLHWKDINFFDHPFSEDIGDVLLGKAVKKGAFNFHSPDNTSDGCLKKRWKIIDGKRCLVKAGSAPLMLQPFNEVIATVVMEKLNIPHVPYWLVWDDEVPYSVCEDFITRDTELVSAWRVMQQSKRDNSTSVYRHYLNCCKALGIADITHAIDQMIVLDYIIANEDRHLNNFGLIRNAETLEWIGVAPIFDSGSSLGYDKLPAQILSGKDVDCKPFKKKHEEQLRLVTNYDWINFAALRHIDEDIRNVFKEAGMYADENRIEAVISSVKRRISNLQAKADEKAAVIDNIEDDVTENIAEDYLHDD
ncbi:MAG: HipA domain-containing protein [Acutalibacteraceae bacterium]